MNKTLLQALFVATSLVAGSVSTYADTKELKPVQTTQIQSENGDQVMYNADATTWTCSQSKVGGSVFAAQSGNNYPGPVILTKFDASSTLSGQTLQKATLSITSKCNVSSKNSNVQVAQIGTGWDATTATWNTVNTADIMKAVNIDEKTNGVNVKNTTTFTIDVTNYLNASTDKTIGFGIYTFTAREQLVSDITLKLEYLDASSVTNYTIKYVDAQGNEIKASTQGKGNQGKVAELTDKEKAAIYSADGSKKYVYDSDDAASNLLAADGSTIITVKFREAKSWNYTLKCVDGEGNTLKEIEESDFEGETVKPGYPYALYMNGTLYTTDKTQSADKKGFQMSFDLTEDNLVKEITYTATETTDVIYLAEGEEIDGVTKCGNSNTAVRSSMAGSAYVENEEGVVITKLEPGTYKIHAVLCDANKTPSVEFKFTIGTNEVSVTAGTINWDEQATDEFTITKAEDVVLQKGGSNTQGLDLIYITGKSSATGINNVNAADQAEGAYYNLQGMKVEKPVKGLYIHNGKKIVF